MRPESNLGKVLTVYFGSTTIKNTEVERKNCQHLVRFLLVVWKPHIFHMLHAK